MRSPVIDARFKIVGPKPQGLKLAELSPLLFPLPIIAGFYMPSVRSAEEAMVGGQLVLLVLFAPYRKWLLRVAVAGIITSLLAMAATAVAWFGFGIHGGLPMRLASLAAMILFGSLIGALLRRRQEIAARDHRCRHHLPLESV